MLALASLAGCGGPSEAELLATVAREAGTNPLCLSVPFTGDVTSMAGGLPRGWIAYSDSPRLDKSGGRSQDIARLQAMAAVGLAVEEPYAVVQDATSVPGRRFFLTDRGRRAMSGSIPEGRACLRAGRLSPQLVLT